MTSGFTLAVDGSTYGGSAALIRDGDVVSSRELDDDAAARRRGEELFLPMVVACLADAGIGPRELKRVVCGAGPGSFTSLRVAASIAKGIAVGAECPMFAISSLVLTVAGNSHPAGRYMATLPAMRGELFSQLIEVDEGGIAALGAPLILPEDSVAGEAQKAGATVTSSRPHARGVAVVLSAIIAAGECDIDTWEPAYGRLAEAQVRWEAAHGRPLETAS